MCLAAVGAMAQPAGGFGGFQAPQVKLETSQEWKDVNYAGDDKAYHTCDIYLPKKAAASYPVAILLLSISMVAHGLAIAARVWPTSAPS